MKKDTKFFASILTIILCLLFCMASCKKPEKSAIAINKNAASQNVDDKKFVTNETGSSITMNPDANVSETKLKKVGGLFPHSIIPKASSYSAVEITGDENDPYVSVIKEYYQLILDESTDVLDTLEYYKYALIDIDGDGVKELLLSSSHSYETRKGNYMFVEHIFTIKDGNIFEVKIPNSQFPNWYYLGGMGVDNREVLSNGLIRITMGPHCCYFRYLKGTLTYVEDFVVNGNEFKHFYPDTKGTRQLENVSKEDFERLKLEVEDGAEVVDLNWQPLESYGK